MDSRGNVGYVASSNRAGDYSDGTKDGLLLLAGVSKVKRLSHSDGTPAIASSVTIINSSGQSVTITPSVARDPTGKQLDTPNNGFSMLAGETLVLSCRIVSILELNSGAAPQAGLGVRYNFTFEPTR